MSRISGVFSSCSKCIASLMFFTLRVGPFVCVGDVLYALCMLCGVFVFSFGGWRVWQFVCVLYRLFGSFTVSRASTALGLHLF